MDATRLAKSGAVEAGHELKNDSHGDRVMTPVNMIWIELEKVNKDK